MLEHPIEDIASEAVVLEGPVKFLNRTGSHQVLHNLYMIMTENFWALYENKMDIQAGKPPAFWVPRFAIETSTSDFNKSAFGIDKNS